MKTYKVVHQDGEEIVVEAEFDNYPDAALYLADSIFMEPFIIMVEESEDFAAMTPDDARKLAIERIEFRQGTSEH